MYAVICKDGLTGRERKKMITVKSGEEIKPATGNEQLQAVFLLLMAYLKEHPEN